MDKSREKKVLKIVAVALVFGYLLATNFFTDFARGFRDGWNEVSYQQNM